MIIVEAKMVGAVTGNRDHLCTVVISNDVERTVETRGSRGNYNVKLYSRGRSTSPRLIKEARVENWPRNAKPAWRLVQAAFEALGT